MINFERLDEHRFLKFEKINMRKYVVLPRIALPKKIRERCYLRIPSLANIYKLRRNMAPSFRSVKAKLR